jgi:tetratricopeptide (TPR) repeat protein
MKQGNYLGAVDDYTRAMGPNPDWQIVAHRGWAYFFAEAHRLALRDFQEALRLNPADLETRIGRGLAYVRLGRDAEAIADARAALERPCDDPVMLLNVACIFARAAGRQDLAGQYPGQAVQALGRALALLSPDARRPFWRGKVLPDTDLDSIKRSPGFLELGEWVERDRPGATLRPTGR